MRRFTVITLSICFGFVHLVTHAQRVYRSNSVLAAGTWAKISIREPGIYKVDVSFLASMGFNTTNISSTTIKLYGNGGQMLSEKNADIPFDDVAENAIMIVDGGDGTFNGADYFLFYANGPDRWLKDSVNNRFIHQKNIYSDSAYYFVTIGSVGKRINSLQVNTSPTGTVNSFNE
jgi:hypothetical protein